MSRYRQTAHDPLLDTLTHLYRRFQDAFVAKKNEASFTVSVVTYGHVDANLCKESRADVSLPWTNWRNSKGMEYIEISETAKPFIGSDVYDELSSLQTGLLPSGARLLVVRPKGLHVRDMLVVEYAPATH